VHFLACFVAAARRFAGRNAKFYGSVYRAAAANPSGLRSLCDEARYRANLQYEAVMANFTPISAAIGGALIGLSAALLMLFNGRIAGITGIAAGMLDPISSDRGWRLAFIVGLIAAPVSAMLVGFTIPIPQMPSGTVLVAVAGLLVGFGTRLANGCTSGHGICGIARLSPRSFIGTGIFMLAAIIVVAVTRHAIGG
jgi:uncharacterized protein